MTAFAENFLNIDVLIHTRFLLIAGLVTTLQLIVASLGIAIGWGLVLSVMRHARIPVVDVFLIGYTDLLRALPVLSLLLILYYALPFVGIELSSFMAATLALSLTGGAYYSEIFRAGIETIQKGQSEAARSLGLSYLQAMWYIILPQAIRIVLPPLTTNTLEFIKSTAVASVVALPDILHKACQAEQLTFNCTPLMGAYVLYLAICLPLVQLIAYLERHFKTDAGRMAQ